MESKKKKRWREKGKLYFTPEAERKVFFFLTLAGLLAGVMFKAGLL